MRVSRVLHLLVLAVPTILIAGCGKMSGPASKPAPAEKKGPVTIDLATLPALDAPIPTPLDEGRVEFSPPQGWQLPPRSSEYVIRFTRSRKASYPAIYVTAENYEAVFNVSDESTAETFAEQRADAITATGTTLTKKVTPLRVGSNWGIAYMKQGKIKNNTVDQMFFETVVAGRKYNYEMRMLTGDFDKYQPVFFAVVGRTRFLKKPSSPKPAGGAPGKPDEGAPKPPDAKEAP